MFLIIIGILLIIFSFPRIRVPIMNRLFNEGLVIPKRIKPEDTQIIVNTGPSTTLFAIGVMMIIIGLII